MSCSEETPIEIVVNPLQPSSSFNFSIVFEGRLYDIRVSNYPLKID